MKKAKRISYEGESLKTIGMPIGGIGALAVALTSAAWYTRRRL